MIFFGSPLQTGLGCIAVEYVGGAGLSVSLRISQILFVWHMWSLTVSDGLCNVYE